jgi:hypothetical protein
MKRTFLLLLALTILASCKKETPAQNQPAAPADTTATPKANSGNDTMVIAGKCGVLFMLPAEKLELMKAQWGEEEFNAAADDAAFYAAEAEKTLDSMGIKSLDAQGKKILKFVKTGQRPYVVNLDSVQRITGIYLFDPAKNPKHANLMDIKNSVKGYYSGKP